MSTNDEPRVDAPRRAYNLRSGRRIEYENPSLSRVSCSPARNSVINDEQDPTPAQPSQELLFESNPDIGSGNLEPPPVTSGQNGNPQELLPDLKKQISSGILRVERLCHHLTFLKNCQEKDVIPKGLMVEKTINPMKSHDLVGFNSVNMEIQEILAQSSKQIIAKLIDYYDRAVISEHDFLRTLNDKLELEGLRVNTLCQVLHIKST